MSKYAKFLTEPVMYSDSVIYLSSFFCNIRILLISSVNSGNIVAAVKNTWLSYKAIQGHNSCRQNVSYNTSPISSQDK